MSVSLYAGLLSQTIDFFIQDTSSSTGNGLSGLLFNSANFTAYYRKGATGASTAITLATQTVGGAWSSGGFVEIDAINMKGAYRFDAPNAMIDTEGFVTLYLRGAANMLATLVRIDCRPIPADVKKLLGTAHLVPATPGTPDVNTKTTSANAITAASLATDAGQELAAMIETFIINEGDATAVMQAIADRIAADWVAGDASPLAIAVAVRTNLTAELGQIVTIKLNTDYPDDCVYLDPTNGIAGIVVGVNGTIGNPSDTFDDANTIATSRGKKRIKFVPRASMTLSTGGYTVDFDMNGGSMILNQTVQFGGGSRIFSSSFMHGAIGADFGAGQNTVDLDSNTFWDNIRFTSNLEATDYCYLTGCVIGNASSALTFTILGDNTVDPVYLEDCYTAKISGLTFDCGGGADLIMNGWYGDFTVTNLAAGTTVQVYGYAKVTLDASCTGGTFRHTSHVEVTDNSGGAVTVDLISQSSDSTIITAVSNLQSSVNTIDDFLDTEMPALTLAVAQIHDRTGYTLTILAGAISNAGTATETYVLTINSVAYTAGFAGLDEGGNRGATTLSKV